METFEKILAKIEELKVSTDKAFNKGNKSQAKKARQQTMELRDLITTLRGDLLRVYSAEIAE